VWTAHVGERHVAARIAEDDTVHLASHKSLTRGVCGDTAMSRDLSRDALCDVAFTTATPFDAGGDEVDHDGLAENLAAMYEAGGRLYIPCGNTGEYYSLTDDERVAVVRTHVEELPDDATIVAGAGGSTKEARRLLERYERAGADAGLVMYPGHTFVHERGLVRYYRRLAEATDLDLVVYRRGPELTQDVLGDLMELDGVAGIKYAVDDVDGFRKTVADAPGDVAVLNGIAERYALAYAIEGADGYTTGIGNFAPGATLALFEAIEAGDWERARAVQDPMNAIERLREGSGPGNAIAAANNVPVVKHGLELAGLAGGPVREPLEKPPEEVTGRVEDAYERLSRVLTEDAG